MSTDSSETVDLTSTDSSETVDLVSTDSSETVDLVSTDSSETVDLVPAEGRRHRHQSEFYVGKLVKRRDSVICRTASIALS